jgi:hypothetical protein
MTIRPSTPEIITVNSEVLETQIRDLLPSQNGFGSELQASNVITPIIDLTATAEGSGLPFNLQTALAFGSQTTFNANNSTVVVANSPGFYRIFGTANGTPSSSVGGSVNFDMTDGSTTKNVWELTYRPSGDQTNYAVLLDFIVWLAAGESISAVSSAVNFTLEGSVRQVADSTGTLVNPSGYPL